MQSFIIVSEEQIAITDVAQIDALDIDERLRTPIRHLYLSASAHTHPWHIRGRDYLIRIDGRELVIDGRSILFNHKMFDETAVSAEQVAIMQTAWAALPTIEHVTYVAVPVKMMNRTRYKILCFYRNFGLHNVYLSVVSDIALAHRTVTGALRTMNSRASSLERITGVFAACINAEPIVHLDTAWRAEITAYQTRLAAALQQTGLPIDEQQSLTAQLDLLEAHLQFQPDGDAFTALAEDFSELAVDE